jgi:hypothetical protein
MLITSSRRVYFSNDCKKNDGSSKQVDLYVKFLTEYFNNKIIDVKDVTDITGCDTEIIRYILDELRHVLYKLIFTRNDVILTRFGCRQYNRRFKFQNINQLKRMISLLEDVEEFLFFSL